MNVRSCREGPSLKTGLWGKMWTDDPRRDVRTLRSPLAIACCVRTNRVSALRASYLHPCREAASRGGLRSSPSGGATAVDAKNGFASDTRSAARTRSTPTSRVWPKCRRPCQCADRDRSEALGPHKVATCETDGGVTARGYRSGRCSRDTAHRGRKLRLPPHRRSARGSVRGAMCDSWSGSDVKPQAGQLVADTCSIRGTHRLTRLAPHAG
jgi:hypothetical protein